MPRTTSNNSKSVQVDGKQLAKLRKLLRVETDQEAVNIAVKRTLAAADAIEAARRIQARGTFGRSWDEIDEMDRQTKNAAMSAVKRRLKALQRRKTAHK